MRYGGSPWRQPISGASIPQDFEQAAYWYRKAAEQGHAEAEFDLARLYARGLGVPNDEAQAAKWFRASASQGYGPAQGRLGVRYSRGRGLPQDDRQAYFWMALASKNGDASVDRLKDALAAKLGAGEVAKLDESVRDWQAQRTSARK